MAKTIAVSDDVYELLVKAKLPNESFSDVIRRAIKKGMKISDIAGSRTISGDEWKEVLKAFELQRKIDEEKMRKLLF
ncbi:MAG: antitoxin VapB family protein [Candidatus Bathyarchaeia archaeon]